MSLNFKDISLNIRTAIFCIIFDSFSNLMSLAVLLLNCCLLLVLFVASCQLIVIRWCLPPCVFLGCHSFEPFTYFFINDFSNGNNIFTANQRLCVSFQNIPLRNIFITFFYLAGVGLKMHYYRR